MSTSTTARPHRYALAAASMIAVAAASVLGSAAPAQAVEAAPSKWELSTLPDLGVENLALTDLSAVATDDVWAVGNAGPKFGRTGVAMHYDGKSWAQVPTPEGIRLSAVTMFDESNGVAVGSNNDGPQSLSWDGDTWTAVAVPDMPAGSWLYKADGVAADDVWAVGNTGTVGVPDGQGFIEHFDGEKWTPAKLAGLADGTRFSLQAITTVSADDAWAVGTVYSEDGGKPLAYHWDGTKWTMQDAGSQLGNLSGVTVLNGEVWAAGFVGSPESPLEGEALLMHLVDGKWTTVATPKDTAWFYDLDVDGKGGLIATGHSTKGAALLRWNGTTAKIETGPVKTAYASATAVANVPGTTTTWVTGTQVPDGAYMAYTS